MISAKTWYKTQNAEFLAIIEAFKTWYYYLEGCKYKILVLINYNNFCQFMDKKNLSSRQVRYGQKLLKDYFQINYCQSKANKAINALFCFL